MSVTSLVVNVDIAKAHVDVAVVGQNWTARRFDNDPSGHQAVVSALTVSTSASNWWFWVTVASGPH